jgi:hypothetical protein
VCKTPFGAPVLPLVLGMKITSFLLSIATFSEGYAKKNDNIKQRQDTRYDKQK